MPKPRSSHVRRRNIALKIETYERLEKFLLELSRERGKRLTFDDAVKALLDIYEKTRKSKGGDNDRLH